MLFAIALSFAFIAPNVPTPTVATTTVVASNGTGTLRVKARPWAKCSVDGSPKRTTPFTLRLPSGRHRVVCTHRSITKTRQAVVVADKLVGLMFKFRAPERRDPKPDENATMGKLVITALPWAKCTVDGRTHTTRFSVTLEPGTYPVTCLKGRARKTATVTVKAGTVSKIQFDFR